MELMGLNQHSLAFRAVPACSPAFSQVMKKQLVQITIFITVTFGPPGGKKQIRSWGSGVAFALPLERGKVEDRMAGNAAPSAGSSSLSHGGIKS